MKIYTHLNLAPTTAFDVTHPVNLRLDSSTGQTIRLSREEAEVLRDVLVRTGVFCGKPATAHIMFITAPAAVVELESTEAKDTFRAQRNSDAGDAVRESLNIKG